LFFVFGAILKRVKVTTLVLTIYVSNHFE